MRTLKGKIATCSFENAKIELTPERRQRMAALLGVYGEWKTLSDSLKAEALEGADPEQLAEYVLSNDHFQGFYDKVIENDQVRDQVERDREQYRLQVEAASREAAEARERRDAICAELSTYEERLGAKKRELAHEIEEQTREARQEHEAQRQVIELDGIAEELRSVDSGQQGLLPALVVVVACLRRERPFAERARALRRKARRLSRALSDAFDSVSNVRYRLPRRSKVFQEVKPYADVHACMHRWEDFGEFLVLRDGLTLQAWRMDKLYEYYVLYRLFDALSVNGFALNESCDEPARRVGYSLQSRYYANETQVANVYRLVCGSERVTLFYEPVVYGNMREENGIDLHRTTRTERGNDSFWTPDCLIRHEANGRVRRIVLDATVAPEADRAADVLALVGLGPLDLSCAD